MTDDHRAAREQTPLQLAHEYAICFAEWRRRHGWRPFSTRQRFDEMTDEEIELALDAAKQRLAALDPAAGRVCVSRDRIGYDEGFGAFKRFVLEKYGPDWEPGDWQIIAEAVWAAIDAALIQDTEATTG